MQENTLKKQHINYVANLVGKFGMMTQRISRWIVEINYTKAMKSSTRCS